MPQNVISSVSKPTIILIPGAWHKPTCYDPLIPHLTSAGYSVETIDLPSVDAAIPVPDMYADVDAVRAAVTKLTQEGHEVVLVMHSYGGLVGSEAGEGLSKEEYEKRGKKGGITQMVYIAGFACDVGESLFSISMTTTTGPGGPENYTELLGETGQIIAVPEKAAKTFYVDLDSDTSKRLVSELCPHSVGSLVSPQTYPAWKHIPSTYVICEKDRALPTEVQERMSKQDGNRFTDVVRLNSGHCPFISMPEVTAKIVRRAAGEGL